MLLREIREDPVAEEDEVKVASEQLNLHNQEIQELLEMVSQAQDVVHKLMVEAAEQVKLVELMVQHMVVMVKQFQAVFQIQELF